MDDINTYKVAAIEAARVAGQILREMLPTAMVREKGVNDLVTDADVAAQNAIQQLLLDRFPHHGWIGEEDVQRSDLRHWEECWVVDPLDGTTNYAHGFPNFAVSIALVRSGVPIVGVVYDPMAEELFCGVRGAGAFLNDRPIASGGCRRLDKALIAASFPPAVHRGSPEVEQFLRVLERSQSLRRLGSAALNLCYTACGRLDGYWTQSVRSWDVAAGSLVCQEAGCTLRSSRGGEFDLWRADLVVASTRELHGELLECLQIDG